MSNPAVDRPPIGSAAPEATSAAPATPALQPAADRLPPVRLRNNPEAIRHAFETGEFPYKSRIGTKLYEELCR